MLQTLGISFAWIKITLVKRVQWEMWICSQNIKNNVDIFGLYVESDVSVIQCVSVSNDTSKVIIKKDW